MTRAVTVRDYADTDWPQVWPIIKEVVRAGDTFPYPTDLTEDVVRELALANTLVDNKVCAIDETWSGLRLVIRLRDR